MLIDEDSQMQQDKTDNFEQENRAQILRETPFIRM